MVINLCYIEGISRIDTPYFTSGSEQESYFESKIVKTIDTTFYPPHYQNAIKVEDSDCDINDTVNYLYFEYKNKNYYYFIDDVEYVSEDLIYLHVTMDYIQTYFFNIRLQNGIIERKFINRFVDDKINRNYIRENVSSTDFILQPKNYLGPADLNNAWVVYKCLNPYKQGSANTSYYTKIWDRFGGSHFAPYFICAIPLKMYDITAIVNKNLPEVEYPFTPQWYQYIESMSPYIVDAWVIPVSPFGNRAYVSGTKLYVDPSLGQVDIAGNIKHISDTHINAHTPLLCEYYTLVGDSSIGGFSYQYRAEYDYVSIEFSSVLPNSLNISKNSSINVLYNERYLPVMLDENYIIYEYGNDSISVSYPMYKIEDLTDFIIPTVYYSLDTSESYIALFSDDYSFNEYNTYVTDTNSCLYDIKVDTYSEYIANNRNRWGVAGLKFGINAISSLISWRTSVNTVKSALANNANNINSLATNPGSIDKRSNNPVLKKSVLRKINDLYLSNETLKNKGLADTTKLLPGDTPLLNQAAEDANYMYAPDNVKQLATFVSKVNVYGMKYWDRFMKVGDFSQCCVYYHRNGYLVNEPVNYVTNIFNYVNTRYYFNVLKISDCDLHLVDVIEDTTTLEMIRSRLSGGLRLWNGYLYQTQQESYSGELDHIGTVIFTPTYPVVDYKNYKVVSITGSVEIYNVAVNQEGKLVVYLRGNGLYSFTIKFNYLVKTITRDIGNFTYDNVEIDNL